MIEPCPLCGASVDGIERVDVPESLDPQHVRVCRDSDDRPDLTIEAIECMRFSPCGHAFTVESLNKIRHELRLLRRMVREMRRTTSADRMATLEEYEIPAQKNVVRKAEGSVERVERAEHDAVTKNND